MATDLTPERLAKLRELALAAESFTCGRLWSYDDGITDYHDGVPERGKHQVVECGASIIVCDPAMQDDNMDRVDAFGRHIAAADPQTVLALVEEVERLRAKNAAYHDRLHHPCEGCPGCSSNDCPDALDIAQIDLAEVRDEILRLRESNAKVTDARDNLLDEVGRLRDERDSWVESVWACLKAAGAPSDMGDAMAALDLVGTKPSHFVRHQFKKLQARVAELEAVMSQRMGVYAAPKDERQVGS